ncbi:hypothetical protein ACJX0J_006920, partial [Zea mays]
CIIKITKLSLPRTSAEAFRTFLCFTFMFTKLGMEKRKVFMLLGYKILGPFFQLKVYLEQNLNFIVSLLTPYYILSASFVNLYDGNMALAWGLDHLMSCQELRHSASITRPRLC